MDLEVIIQGIRTQKGLKQIDVANHIGVDKSTYSKIEKGLRALTIEELVKMASLFDMTTDQVLNYEDGNIPEPIVFEDNDATQQLKLLAQLDEDDKQIIFKIIDKMLTTKKFKEFFEKNLNKP